MKQVYIFVEGPTEAAFVRRILPPEMLQDAEVVDAGGSAGIASLARSVLVRRGKPVAVVMDADSIVPDVVEERLESTQELIQAAAAVPVKVVAAVPDLEAWLFAAPEVIERALGAPVPADLIALGKRDPSWVLQLLAQKANRTWDARRAIDLLDNHDIDRIRAVPEVRELGAFLESVQKDAGVA